MFKNTRKINYNPKEGLKDNFCRVERLRSNYFDGDLSEILKAIDFTYKKNSHLMFHFIPN